MTSRSRGAVSLLALTGTSADRSRGSKRGTLSPYAGCGDRCQCLQAHSDMGVRRITDTPASASRPESSHIEDWRPAAGTRDEHPDPSSVQSARSRWPLVLRLAEHTEGINGDR